jgi:predicted nucleotidyltransferase
MQSSAKVIEKLVRHIVNEVNPLRIILFGSAVRGKIGPDSDIDILIVMPEGVHRRRIAQFLYKKVSGLGMPFDIIVATPSDLEKHKDNIGLIYRTVLQEGKEIYAA